jgi:hypothetical protein
MSLSERLRQWLRALTGGGAAGTRRLPDPVGCRPADQQADKSAIPLAAPLGSMGAPNIAFRRTAVFAAFNTAVPVSDRHGLAGRKKELGRLVDAVVKQRKHALIFGARGSGKTSLVRVFGDMADEAGCVALYGSAGAGADIDGIFRPYLAELPLHRGAPAVGEQPLTVQQLANLFTQGVTQRTLLIVDEFDRVSGERTRHDMAALLKLLSDMHAPVQLVLVGIAGNVDGLIAAHPSLRRHLFAQPVLPIERDELAGLLRLCAKQAGVGFDEDAAQAIVSAAVGSPYHARLFGMQAALAAEAAERERITLADAQKGLDEALAEWGELNPELHALFGRALAEAGPLRGLIALTGVLAAHAPALTLERMTAAGTELFGESLGGEQAVDRAVALIGPALAETPVAGEFQFEDSLSPQFLVLIANRAGSRPAASQGFRRETADARALLQGVGEL